MALLDLAWYVNFGDGSTTGYYAVPQWTALTVYSAGQWVRQLATPTVGNERCFVCIVAGTSLAAEPTWTVTRGAKTAEAAGPTWQECTGVPATCGDTTNTPAWLAYKNGNVTLGAVIFNSGNSSIQICSTAGTAGNGATPAFSATAGTTTVDNAATWTSLGPSSNYTTNFKYPHARLANSYTATWGIAGNTFAVSSIHAETQATAITLSNPGTSGSPCSVYCISNSTNLSSATLSTAATISTTGANNINLGNGFSYYYGLNYNAGSAANAANILYTNNGNFNAWWESCTFTLNNTNTASLHTFGRSDLAASGNMFSFLNSAFVFGNASQSIKLQAEGYSVFITGGSAAATGTVPTQLFSLSFNNAGLCYVVIRDANFSAVTGTLMNASSSPVYVQNCKLGSGVTVFSGTPGQFNGQYHMANCDSTNTNYRYSYNTFTGTTINENTIVRTGSFATNGATTISWNMTSNANSLYIRPFQSEEIMQWNDSTGSALTATIYLVTGTTLNNNDFWAEIEYLGTSGFPLGVNATSRMTPLATPAALTTDSTSTWGGSTNKYSVSLSFTPQVKGPVKARFYLAKLSTTVYVDPIIYITDAAGNLKSAGRAFFIPGWGYSAETAPSFLGGARTGGMNG